MELLLLGPIAISHDGRDVPLGRRRERLLLAVLGLSPRRAVPMERLAALGWDYPSTDVRSAMQVSVSRLRKSLEPYGVSITSRGEAYTLEIDPERVDAVRFRAAVTAALAMEAPRDRAVALRSALGLWRGELAEDVIDADRAWSLAADLVELRLIAQERCLEAELAVGRSGDIVPELRGMHDRHPIHEGFARLLMEALVAAGRPADALSVYADVRDRLAEELGADPGPALADTHLAILRQQTADQDAIEARTVPRQLPRAVIDFVGRADDLRRLDELAEPGRTVTVGAVRGMGGLGKTALVTMWAYGHRDRFPDGQLFIDLRAYGSDHPMSNREALSYLLRALGQPGEAIPDEEPAAVAMYRTVMADRRMLLVLDNAGSAAQVRTLLPGAPLSTVLVTSRDSLAGLVATAGARIHTLGLLAAEESLTLLRTVAGPDRLDAEPDAAARLANLAGHLPLALRILAARLALDPTLTVSALVDAVEVSRLRAIAIEDDTAADITAVFDASYHALPTNLRAALRAYGILSGPDVSVPAFAALRGVDAATAAAELAGLAAAHLLTESTPGRYAAHDLIREYAHQRALADNPAHERDEAAERMAVWYAAEIRSAIDMLFPQIGLMPDDGLAAPAYPNRDTARVFLDGERDNVLALMRPGRTPIRPLRRCQLFDAIRMYFWLFDMNTTEWTELGVILVGIADTLDDPYARAATRFALGIGYRQMGDTDKTADVFGEAYDIAVSIDWEPWARMIAANAAVLETNRGNYLLAYDQLTDVVAHCQAIGSASAEATYQINLAVAAMRLGRLAEAEERLNRALHLAETHDIHVIRGFGHHNLGTVLCYAGRFAEAEQHLRAALVTHDAQNGDSAAMVNETLAQVYRDTDRLAEAHDTIRAEFDVFAATNTQTSAGLSYNTYGTILTALGRPAEARDAHRTALEIGYRTRSAAIQIDALIGLADADLAEGRPDDAEPRAADALDQSHERGMRIAEGQALRVLAEIAAHRGDTTAARERAETALALHRECGHEPGARRAEAVLAALRSSKAGQ